MNIRNEIHDMKIYFKNYTKYSINTIQNITNKNNETQRT